MSKRRITSPTDYGSDEEVDTRAPRSRSRSSGRVLDVDSIGEEFSFTQGEEERWTNHVRMESNKQGTEAAARRSADLKNVLSKTMARFLLMKEGKHEPITRAQCISEVMGDASKGRNTTFVIQEASRLLFNTFGYNLSCTPDGRAKPWYTKDNYYLTNSLSKPPYISNDVEYGVLMVILGIINCQNEKAIESVQLFRALHSLDSRIPQLSDSSSKKNMKGNANCQIPAIGSVQDLIKAFVHQHYLIEKKKPSQLVQDEFVLEYSMGARAYLEVGRPQMLLFMHETMDIEWDPALRDELSDSEDLGESDDSEKE